MTQDNTEAEKPAPKTREEKVQELQTNVDETRSFVDWLRELWSWVKGIFGK